MSKGTNENMRIWDALGKTDPAHTKQFTRAGGFKGTAIKPMWANKQMTEFFGPCGIGWGQTEPTFQTISTDGEVLVYCTVGLWYMNATIKCGPIYGVGGDKVLTQIFEKDRSGNKVKDESAGRFRTYPQTDDEAFKKAYTDALSNAMKFIGVAADIHMGLFDDNKYVQSVREEFKEEDEARKKEVFAEVERQKTATNTKLVEMVIPSEVEWEDLKPSGVLIARVMDAKLGKKKDGGEFVVLTLNRAIEGKTPLLYYWHATHRQELLAAKGKVVKLEVVAKAKGYTLEHVLEIDGVRMMPGDGDYSPETKARFLASTLDYDEESLREVHGSICGGDWGKVVAHLEGVKARRDAGDAV